MNDWTLAAAAVLRLLDDHSFNEGRTLMELEDELKRFEIGDKLFMYLIDQTEGQTGKAIIAIAYTLANIEAQSPGALALVIEGAELLAKKIKMIEAIVRITELQEAPPPDPKTLN